MSLNGSHVLVTGVTGFLGQALLERLLWTYPDCRVSVLVRSTEAATADERFMELLDKPVFTRLRDHIGGAALESLVRERVSVVTGDLTTLGELPADLDTVFHAASNVSFDAPIDEAFIDNVGGPAALYRSLCSGATDPHVVHVSTSYTAGLRRGVAEEVAIPHTIDDAAELAHAIAARARVEELSRTPDVLHRLVREAEQEHGQAGHALVAAAAEKSRVDWVRRQLAEQGRVRARSVGWADVYTLTKALGERVAERLWAHSGHRLSIVRPTIIESALQQPFPGWIDGFKVMDPMIAAYARGALPVFPGNADTVIDVIPVDFVVSAILAAASIPPKSNEVKYFQVSSGMTNPLRLGRIADLTTEYFSHHPLPEAESAVVTWTFPNPSAVERNMRRRELAVTVTDAVVAQLPSMARTRQWSTALAKSRRDLTVLRQLMSLYQPYVQFEIIFDDAETRRLQHAVDEDPTLGGFDVTTIDWRHYLQDVHLPQLPEIMGRPSRRSASAPAELPRRDDVVAAFDLHSIVPAASLVGHYVRVELASQPKAVWSLSLAALIATAPQYLMVHRRDQAEFIRLLMRRYAGCAEQELRRIIAGTVGPALRGSTFADALDRIEAHRQAGHHTVLMAGEIDLFVEPLAPLFDKVVAGSMDVDEQGRWTGHLSAPPVVGEARAVWLRRYARECAIDLEASYAYGRSYGDRPWLEQVGFPHVVNPDLKLHRHATKQRWPVHSWTAPDLLTGRSARPSPSPTRPGGDPVPPATASRRSDHDRSPSGGSSCAP